MTGTNENSAGYLEKRKENAMTEGTDREMNIEEALRIMTGGGVALIGRPPHSFGAADLTAIRTHALGAMRRACEECVTIETEDKNGNPCEEEQYERENGTYGHTRHRGDTRRNDLSANTRGPFRHLPCRAGRENVKAKSGRKRA
jgi:hypothetical protein